MNNAEFYRAATEELLGIERGDVTVEMSGGDILLGKVEYRTGNGWTIVVFSDGDDWDYIDAIVPPSGERFSLWPEKPDDDSEELRKLRSYQPPSEQLRKVWGFLT